MKYLIVGATSAIAEATARAFLNAFSSSDQYVLVGRNLERLKVIADDLSLRGAAQVEVIECDLSQPEKMEALVSQAWQLFDGIDLALIAHGTLPDQEEVQNDWAKTALAYNTNGLSYIALMTALGREMEVRKTGKIIVISSVAGDRGRQSNYVYGSAKGAVSLFAQGLRNRLAAANVQVLTVKPGFVDTPMTADIDKKGLLWSTPERVAKDILKAVKKGRNVLYTPFFWWPIMLIIKSIPERIFKKLSL